MGCNLATQTWLMSIALHVFSFQNIKSDQLEWRQFLCQWSVVFGPWAAKIKSYINEILVNMKHVWMSYTRIHYLGNLIYWHDPEIHLKIRLLQNNSNGLIWPIHVTSVCQGFYMSHLDLGSQDKMGSPTNLIPQDQSLDQGSEQVKDLDDLDDHSLFCASA